MSNITKEIEEGKRLCVTIPEVASLLGISRNHAYELVKQGKLPVIRLGKRILVPRVQLDKFLEKGYME